MDLTRSGPRQPMGASTPPLARGVEKEWTDSGPGQLRDAEEDGGAVNAKKAVTPFSTCETFGA